MKILSIILIIIIIIVVLSIITINSYNKLNTIYIKINNSEEKISKNLKKKYELLLNLTKSVKKVLKKKDYLKEFNSIEIDNIDNYKLDDILDKTNDLVIKLIEDNKEINTKENKEKLNEIDNINQKLTASKKYFNKNNNLLMKSITSYHKIIAKIFKITVRNSYEIKEPID